MNSRKHVFGFTAFLIIYFMMMILSCNPSIGTPWYPRSASGDTIPLYVGEITVVGAQVKANDSAKSFNDSPDYTVSVPNTLTDISIAQIKVKLFSDPKLEKKFPEASVTLEIAGDSVPLVTDTYTPVLLRIKPSGIKYTVIEKTLKVKRLPKSTAYLERPTICGIAASPAPDFAVSGNYIVSVPNEIEAITKEHVSVSLFADEKKENAISGSTVTVSGGMVQLAPDVPAAVLLTITPPEPYKALQTTVMVTREAAQVKPLNEQVLVQEIKIQNKAAASANGSYALTLPHAVKKIIQSDIAVSLVTNDETKTPIADTTYSIRLLTGNSVPLPKDGTPVYLAIELTLTDPAGQLIKIVKVTREKKPDDDPGTPGDPSNPGGSGDDDDDDIGGGGSSNDEDNDNKPDADSTPIPPFNPNKPGSNPKDAEGHFKWILTTTEQLIDPFDYYKSNSNGFSASKFDDWVVYISSFDNGTNVASYMFKEGVWSGSPERYRGPNFGSFPKTTWEVDFYRYKTRKARWEKHGGYQPDADPRDKRFYFYRFTGKTMSPTLDNSMFCVDRYSKFLFYYSDPRDINGQGVPSEWRDYAQPTEGKHKHFDEPFYMSDPVGYVEADGTVVMYEWIKRNISKNNYTAQKNSAYDKPAQRDPGKPGYSPYRDKIKGNPIQKWVENPEYTAAAVTVKKEPEPREVIQGAKGWFVQAIPNAVPEGEQLSYQWYTTTSGLAEGGTPASGGKGETESAYFFPTDTAKEVYYYCKITNTNSKNGKSTSVTSRAVKVIVKKGMAVVHIKKPKTGGSLSVMMGGQSIEDGAEVERGSMLTLTATPAADFTVSSWINAKPRTDNPLIADAVVTKNITVGVKFKSTTAPPAEKVKLFCFYNEELKGTLKAEMNGTLLEISKNGIEVEKGSVVTFTATPTDDYTFSGWVGSISGRETPKTVTIKENMFITVDFALKRFAVNYVCEPVEGGTLTVLVGTLPHESGEEVEKTKTVTFTATPHDGYYLSGWEGWDGASAAGENATVGVKIAGPTSVKAVFKREYPVTFGSDNEEQGTLTATVDGKPIESGAKVREGQNVTFTASPNPGYYVKNWEGITPQPPTPQRDPMEVTRSLSTSLNVTAVFGKIMRLTVTPKILNVDLASWSTEGGSHHADPTYVDGVHLAYKCSIKATSSEKSSSPPQWSYMFPLKNKDGLWLQVQSDHFIKKGQAINGKGQTVDGKRVDVDETFIPSSDLKLMVSNYLLKANRHDYWYAEWTTGTTTSWPYSTQKPALYPLQALDDNSSFPLVYDETTSVWKVDAESINIKHSEHIPLPAEYADTKPDPNRKISYKGVTITYDKNFTLTAGDEKDFVITYTVDNDPDSPTLKKIHDGTPVGTRSKGTIKVIYTIGWK